MQKILLFILLLGVIYFVRRAISKSDAPTQGAAQPAADSTADVAAESVHACAQCGLMVPRSECVARGDEQYCCAEHARLGPSTGQ